MATFGQVRERIIKPKSTPRDLSYMQPYVEAVQELIDAGQNGQMVESTMTIDPADFGKERARLKNAGRQLKVFVSMRATSKDKDQVVFWLEPNKEVKETAAEKVSRLAKEAGVTIAEYKALHPAQVTSSSGKRGRPKKTAA